MGIRLYDEALTAKIKSWIKDRNLQVLKPDESTRFLEMKIDENNDKPLHLPLISLSREKTVEILNMQKQPKTFDGVVIQNSSSHGIILNAIPVQVNYQLDIYTKGMIEADEYVRNFVFNFINYPKLEIKIPYNDIFLIHQSKINLDSSIIDNSDIKEHIFPDQFVRFSLKLRIEDAYLFSAPVKEAAYIDNFTIQSTDLSIKNDVELAEIITE